MASEPKKRKIEAICGNILSSAARGDKLESSSHGSPPLVTYTGGKDQRIVQAKNFAIAEAQQDHWLGSFNSFDSSFGNFIVPVIPTRTDLSR